MYPIAVARSYKHTPIGGRGVVPSGAMRWWKAMCSRKARVAVRALLVRGTADDHDLLRFDLRARDYGPDDGKGWHGGFVAAHRPGSWEWRSIMGK